MMHLYKNTKYPTSFAIKFFLLFLLIFNVSCSSDCRKTVTASDRIQYVHDLADDINKVTNTHYGNVILKYDLLHINENKPNCFPSSLYHFLIIDKQEDANEYLSKIHVIKHQILAYRDLLKTAIKNTPKVIIKLEELLKLHPQKYSTNHYMPVFRKDSEDIFSVLEEETLDARVLDARVLDELVCFDNFTKHMPIYQPLYKYKVTSEFGHRRDPFNGKKKYHRGIDLYSKDDQRIYAAGPGIVETSGHHNGYGNIITIKHGDGFSTCYAHLSKRLVEVKDIVTANQLIGIQGKTGKSTKEHLHYEIRYNNNPINPRKFLIFNHNCRKCIK